MSLELKPIAAAGRTFSGYPLVVICTLNKAHPAAVRNTLQQITAPLLLRAPGTATVVIANKTSDKIRQRADNCYHDLCPAPAAQFACDEVKSVDNVLHEVLGRQQFVAEQELWWNLLLIIDIGSLLLPALSLANFRFLSMNGRCIRTSMLVIMDEESFVPGAKRDMYEMNLHDSCDFFVLCHGGDDDDKARTCSSPLLKHMWKRQFWGSEVPSSQYLAQVAASLARADGSFLLVNKTRAKGDDYLSTVPVAHQLCHHPLSCTRTCLHVDGCPSARNTQFELFAKVATFWRSIIDDPETAEMDNNDCPFCARLQLKQRYDIAKRRWRFRQIMTRRLGPHVLGGLLSLIIAYADYNRRVINVPAAHMLLPCCKVSRESKDKDLDKGKRE